MLAAALRASYTYDTGDMLRTNHHCLRPECLASTNTNIGTHMLGDKARGKMLNLHPDAPVDMPGWDTLAPEHRCSRSRCSGSTPTARR